MDAQELDARVSVIPPPPPQLPPPLPSQPMFCEPVADVARPPRLRAGRAFLVLLAFFGVQLLVGIMVAL